MKRELIVTEDGSSSIYIPEMDETYHSTHGAIQEARHVFIEHGLKKVNQPSIRVLEMGFGTGLNALLTAIECVDLSVRVDYIGVEAFPVEEEMINNLNYCSLIAGGCDSVFERIHQTLWSIPQEINKFFTLTKIESKIQDYAIDSDFFDLIYFDAFGPRVQSELWSEEVLQKMHCGLKQGGILVTYCAQGQFKRNLKTVGFEVQTFPGPPGKREMTIALKR
jgi:tRNA U34 5-methylaminomethyl-2-thiouridine-forming methyltransferase MnmC